MRVKTDNPRHRGRTHELSTLLTPSEPPDEYNGRGDTALSLARVTAERFGRLAEMLVEKGVLTLDEAADAAGYPYNLEKVS